MNQKGFFKVVVVVVDTFPMALTFLRGTALCRCTENSPSITSSTKMMLGVVVWFFDGCLRARCCALTGAGDGPDSAEIVDFGGAVLG